MSDAVLAPADAGVNTTRVVQVFAWKRRCAAVQAPVGVGSMVNSAASAPEMTPGGVASSTPTQSNAPLLLVPMTVLAADDEPMTTVPRSSAPGSAVIDAIGAGMAVAMVTVPSAAVTPATAISDLRVDPCIVPTPGRW